MSVITRIVAGVAFLAGLSPALATAGEDHRATLLPVLQRVADWQIAHLDDPPARDTLEHDFTSPRGWIKAVFVVGLTELAERQPRYRDTIFRLGGHEGWRLGTRIYHADDHLIGQAWIWAYEHSGDPAALAGVKSRFDAILVLPPEVALDDRKNCTQRWCWCDALFMAPATWMALSQATGDARYREYADKEFWATADKLFDHEEGLFYRDGRFIGRNGDHGEKIFWARGNGWVFAGLARMLDALPRNDPHRARYEALFRTMAQRIVALQKPDGSWPMSLLGDPAGTPPETSATGLFVAGLGYGIKTGLLRGPQYRAAAWRGWAALKRAVFPDGMVGWVQRDGDRPGAVAAENTQPFGPGALLLAGAALYDIAQP